MASLHADVEAELPASVRTFLDRREVERADLGHARVQTNLDDLARIARELGLDRRQHGQSIGPHRRADGVVAARGRAEELERDRLTEHEAEGLAELDLGA